jgi:hypothetical protein
MTTAETRQVLEALATDYAYIGIRPEDATPAEAPCILLNDHNVNGLQYALASAVDRWQTCQQWALIGSDEMLHLIDPTWPPTLRAFRQPAQLATFTTP